MESTTYSKKFGNEVMTHPNYHIFSSGVYDDYEKVRDFGSNSVEIFHILIYINRYLNSKYSHFVHLTETSSSIFKIWSEYGKFITFVNSAKSLNFLLKNTQTFVLKELLSWINPFSHSLMMYCCKRGMLPEIDLQSFREKLNLDGIPTLFSNLGETGEISCGDLNFEESKDLSQIELSNLLNLTEICCSQLSKSKNKYDVIQPYFQYFWYKHPDIPLNNFGGTRVFCNVDKLDLIDAHFNFFDDLENGWFAKIPPSCYFSTIDQLYIKYGTNDNQENENVINLIDLIENGNNDYSELKQITRLSAILNTPFYDGSKRTILQLLMSCTNYIIPFSLIRSMHISKLSKGCEWTIIEWFFSEDSDEIGRSVFARTLIHIAYSLWLKFGIVILYPDAIQIDKGHRITDINITETEIQCNKSSVSHIDYDP